jgi:hypothetical protein
MINPLAGEIRRQSRLIAELGARIGMVAPGGRLGGPHSAWSPCRRGRTRQRFGRGLGGAGSVP